MDRRKVFNAFNPNEALPPHDPRYVDFSKERASSQLIRNMADYIRLTEGTDTCCCQLISGHRGCGKTTELFRLRDTLMLPSPDTPSYYVVYCEVDAFLDLNDIEVFDVLLAMLQQIAADFQTQKWALGPIGFQKFWQDFVDNIPGVTLKQVDPAVDVCVPEVLKAGLKLGFEFNWIKRDQTNRAKVRQYLSPRTTNFLEAINEILEQATTLVKGKGYEGLVVIVDNLDRMMRQPIPGLGITSQELLFVNYASLLSGLKCHAIYTLPPALTHSVGSSNLAATYGIIPKMLPMVPIETRQGTGNKDGMESLHEAVEKRLASAGASCAEVFDSKETVEALCRSSGGYVRTLMALARQAVLQTDTYPILRASVEEAIRQARNGFMVGLMTSHLEILRQVRAGKQLIEQETCMQLLQNMVILEYHDMDGPWYDVIPIVRDTMDAGSPPTPLAQTTAVVSVAPGANPAMTR